MNSQNEHYDIHDLLIYLLENDLTDSQRDHLIEWSQRDPGAVTIYHDFLRTYSIISHEISSRVEINDGASSDTQFDQAVWEALLDYEKTAPEIQIPHEKLKQKLIQKVVYPPRKKREKTKFGVFILLNTAAILLFVLFLRFAAPDSEIEVATLADSMNARWANVEREMVKGASIATSNKSLLLREGYAELLYNNQTKVIIEGPAEFKILAEDQIKLSYGRLYAIVPREAIGFTVKTLSSQIVDLGTEFGVQADFQGDTTLHVMKGKTVLIAGDKSNKVSVEATEGVAKKVSAENQTISDISCNTRLFAREIDSTCNLVWRGQMKVDLADIVGGGDGFGTGRESLGIEPTSGKLVNNPSMFERTQKTYGYSSVPGIPYIDGVFVPLGGDNPQVVTSRGDVFKECPETDGRYWIEITNKPLTSLSGNADGQTDDIQLARLDGVQYGTDMHPAIMMHANTGITFDLEVIRSTIPGVKIRNFTSFCGLSETLNSTALQKEASADMWVLVDGQPREKIHVDFLEKDHAFVTVNIDDKDRFLTLVSCSDWNAGDWTFYGDPALELERLN